MNEGDMLTVEDGTACPECGQVDVCWLCQDSIDLTARALMDPKAYIDWRKTHPIGKGWFD